MKKYLAVFIFVFFILFVNESFADKKVEEFIELGDKNLENRQYDLALDNYNNALEIEPENIEALNGIGAAYLYLDLDNKTQSIYYFDQVIAIKPDHIPTLINLGIIAGQNNQTALSLQYFDKVLEKDENHLSALINKSTLLAVYEYDVHNAILLLNKVLDIDPTNEDAIYNKILMFESMNTSPIDGLVQTELRDKDGNLIGYAESDRIIISEYIPYEIFNEYYDTRHREFFIGDEEFIMLPVKIIQEATYERGQSLKTGYGIGFMEEIGDDEAKFATTMVRQHGMLIEPGDVWFHYWQLIFPKSYFTEQ